MCVPCAERVILSASEGPPQCPSLPCGLKLFSPPSILLFLAPARYTFLETVLVARKFSPRLRSLATRSPQRLRRPHYRIQARMPDAFAIRYRKQTPTRAFQLGNLQQPMRLLQRL